LSGSEWPLLLECASPHADLRRLAELVQLADGPRLLALAEDHGVLGHLAARLRGMDENLVSPETMRALPERQRAQIFFSLKRSLDQKSVSRK
jgi:hypothetical protein